MFDKPLLTSETGGLLTMERPFDPKAVTRESWKPAKQKPKATGPLISFNIHPDAYGVKSTSVGAYRLIGPRSKSWIQSIRIVQLIARIIEVPAAIGILFLFIVLTKVPQLTAWVLRATGGAASLHCSYSAYHHSRRAGGRSPASSSAYQLFSAFIDACIIGIYCYGVVAVHNNGSSWSTFMDSTIKDTLVSCAYYGLMGSCGVHFISLSMSGWLAYMFYLISKMPPDMNPLQMSLTTRVRRHKKSKSSVTSTASIQKDLFGASEAHRISIKTMDELNSPRRTVPFLDSLPGSPDSANFKFDGRINLPSRQYQIVPGNRDSRSGSIDQGRPSLSLSIKDGSYTQVLTYDSSPTKSRPTTAQYNTAQPMSPTPARYKTQPISPTKSRPGTGNSASKRYTTPRDMSPAKPRPSPAQGSPRISSPTKSRPPISYKPPQNAPSNPKPPRGNAEAPRAPKFTEAWAPSDSLIGRTQKRLNHEDMRLNRSYEALQQLCDGSDSDDMMGNSDDDGYLSPTHVSPLRLNPMTGGQPPPPPPHRTNVSSVNGGVPGSPSSSTSKTGSDNKTRGDSAAPRPIQLPMIAKPRAKYRRDTLQNDVDDDDDDDDDEFSSKPYGALLGGSKPGATGGKISAGKDYESRSSGYGRRNVSGKMAEEGLIDHGRDL